MKKIYPIYHPFEGNLTGLIRKEYIEYKINQGRLPKNAFEIEEITSLVASNDRKKKLYFWQLYSIIGEKSVEDLITIFYSKIFNDDRLENKWFTSEFIEIGPLEYHILGQKNFWLDIMGAGKYYKGNKKKLYNYHKLVKNIMNKNGADLWMNYMKESIFELKNRFEQDNRIIYCLFDFLNYFMIQYSIEFDFNFYEIIKSKL